ncbi:MAG: hypothetical protein WC601_08010 [Desulfotomaculaceae bacterium]
MAGFRLICGNCGSDQVLEKSAQKQLDFMAGRVKYGEGIQRKCNNCANEDFIVFRTWMQ